MEKRCRGDGILVCGQWTSCQVKLQGELSFFFFFKQERLVSDVVLVLGW